MIMQELLIAVDGGGTKTDLVLFDLQGRILRRVLAPGCNPNDFGWERTEAVLRDAFRTLLSEGANPQYLFAGISGGSVGNNREHMRKLLARLLPQVETISADSDAVNALASGTGGGDGSVVISGTGSVGFVRTNGVLQQIGGWGYLFDKGGSGYDLGRDAVYHALCDIDGRGEHTRLTALLEETLGAPVNEAVTSLYQEGKPAIAALAPLVFEAASLGDDAAKEILSQNGAELARLFNAVSARVPESPCPTVLAGSIFKRWDMLAPYVEPHLIRRHRFLFPQLPPVYGAAVEALALAGQKAGETFQRNFAASLSG